MSSQGNGQPAAYKVSISRHVLELTKAEQAQSGSQAGKGVQFAPRFGKLWSDFAKTRSSFWGSRSTTSLLSNQSSGKQWFCRWLSLMPCRKSSGGFCSAFPVPRINPCYSP